MHKLVVIVGMPGSGKGELVSHLVDSHRYQRVYFGGTVLKILEEKGFEHNEVNERSVREEVRRIHGRAAMAILNLPEIKDKLGEGDVVIDGLYSWAEYLLLKGAIPEMRVVAVYASPETRYQRLAKRKVRPLTKATAIARDHAQLENIETGPPIAMADHTIINEGLLRLVHSDLDHYISSIAS